MEELKNALTCLNLSRIIMLSFRMIVDLDQARLLGREPWGLDVGFAERKHPRTDRSPWRACVEANESVAVKHCSHFPRLSEAAVNNFYH